MLNIGTGEILVILLMALLVLGPDKLPGAARTLGKATREVRRLSNGLQHEMREAMKAADIDLDVPGLTAPAAGAAKATGSGLHPGLGPGPRLGPGAVVIDGTVDGATTRGPDQSEVPDAASVNGSGSSASGVVHTDGPSGSFS
jgi:Tat protein translocase TatB subunit